MIFRSLTFALLLAVALPASLRAQQAAEADVAPAQIADLLHAAGPLDVAGQSLDRAELTALYAKRDFRPLWTPVRAAALQKALAAAPSQGVDPRDVAVPDAPAAAHELLLTGALLRYGAVLARGAVAPRSIETDWMLAPLHFDAAALLARVQSDDVGAALAALAPHDPAYERLRQALVRYRDFAAAQAWGADFSIDAPLLKGAQGPAVARLRARLAAEGYLPAAGGDVFDDALADVVKRYQAQRGVVADGVVDRDTVAAFNVTPAERVQEIRLNLERWRSLPRGRAATRVEVNVPAEQAVLYEADKPVLTIRAIVGGTDHPTPLLTAAIQAVVFNPAWHVPQEIADGEINALAQKDPDFLTRNGYVRVDGKRLVQKPGPLNVLGQVKFDMPNSDDIYIHDADSKIAYAEAVRAYSHGCVRIETPRALAQKLLAGSGWSVREIWAAIGSGKTRRVTLPRAVPAYLLYWTAFVDPDGAVEFRNDLYGRDERLAGALDRREPPRLASN